MLASQSHVPVNCRRLLWFFNRIYHKSYVYMWETCHKYNYMLTGQVWKSQPYAGWTILSCHQPVSHKEIFFWK